MHQGPTHQCCCLTEKMQWEAVRLGWVSEHHGPDVLELNNMTQDSIADNTSTREKKSFFPAIISRIMYQGY